MCIARDQPFTEPGAGRGPQAGSPLGVVVATGSLAQPTSGHCVRPKLPGGNRVLTSGRYGYRFCNVSPRPACFGSRIARATAIVALARGVSPEKVFANSIER